MVRRKRFHPICIYAREIKTASEQQHLARGGIFQQQRKGWTKNLYFICSRGEEEKVSSLFTQFEGWRRGWGVLRGDKHWEDIVCSVAKWQLRAPSRNALCKAVWKARFPAAF
ncbi:hypothetical protein CEXT_646191 [Caerostris extrusa]|uniref:Uncharacterized protein n=1 Tax=Caerostris extrusa TaxID=172846 RepID=A0AAV4XHD6_CAEEX|nr:hypothetical protein CEXT_646191 [Caerostris extrusa]